jgi:hypothetical protein
MSLASARISSKSTKCLVRPVPRPAFLIRRFKPRFQPGDPVRVSNRWPIAHYRVPLYLRGRVGWIETVIEPTAVNNEEEGFGRNAGDRRHYYRVAFAMTEVWPDYAGSPHDSLRIEVFESWLEKEKT